MLSRNDDDGDNDDAAAAAAAVSIDGDERNKCNAYTERIEWLGKRKIERTTGNNSDNRNYCLFFSFASPLVISHTVRSLPLSSFLCSLCSSVILSVVLLRIFSFLA